MNTGDLSVSARRSEHEVDGVPYVVTREGWHPGFGRRFALREVRAGAAPVVAHVYLNEPDPERAMKVAVARLIGE